MSVIFGPDTFTVSVDTDIEQYPAVSPGNHYEYNIGGGLTFTCQALQAFDNARGISNLVNNLARCVAPGVPQNMSSCQTQGVTLTSAAGGDPRSGQMIRYNNEDRGYVAIKRTGVANESQILEDDGGYTLLASADYGGILDNTFGTQTFRAVGGANGTLLTFSPLGGAARSMMVTDTTAAPTGAPGLNLFRDAEGLQIAYIDNFQVDDLAGYPLVAGVMGTDGSTATTTPAINLPSGIEAGETLLILVRNAAGGTITFPSEGTTWIQLFEDSSDGSNDTTALAWKKADGTEGATVSLTFGTSGKFAALAFRIKNAADPTVRPPEFSTLTTGSGVGADAGTVTPTGGTKKYLFILMIGAEGENAAPPGGVPVGASATDMIYSATWGASSGTGGAVATNCEVVATYREAEAASENPGNWNALSSAADDWTATCVAIHPIGAAEFMPAAGAQSRSGGWIGGGPVL